MKLKIPSSMICVDYDDKECLYLQNRINNKKYIIKGTSCDRYKTYITPVNVECEECLATTNNLISEGLLIDAEVDPQCATIRKARSSEQLNVVQLEVTERCNFKCIHCYLGEKKYAVHHDMPLNDIKNIIAQASDLGVLEFNITGGEPLLRSDIRVILQYIYEKGMRTRLYTNGYLLNDEFIDFLKRVNIYCVRISIDSIRILTHDLIRGMESLERILENIRKLQEVDIDVEVTTVVMRENINDIEDIINAFKNRNKLRHFIDVYVPVEGNEQSVSESEFISAIKTKFEQDKSHCRLCERHCGIAYDYLYIDSSGRVKLCPMLKDTVGCVNFGEKALEDVWLTVRKKYSNIRCKYSDSCKYALSCGGGCRARAYYLTGDITEKDSYICELYRYLYTKYNQS